MEMRIARSLSAVVAAGPAPDITPALASRCLSPLWQRNHCSIYVEHYRRAFGFGFTCFLIYCACSATNSTWAWCEEEPYIQYRELTRHSQVLILHVLHLDITSSCIPAVTTSFGTPSQNPTNITDDFPGAVTQLWDTSDWSDRVCIVPLPRIKLAA